MGLVRMGGVRLAREFLCNERVCKNCVREFECDVLKNPVARKRLFSL